MDFYDLLLAKKLSGGGGGGSGFDDPEDFTGGNILAIKSHGTEYILTDFYGKIECISATKMSDNNVTAYEGYWSLYNANSNNIGLQRNASTTSMIVKFASNTQINVAIDGYSSGNIIVPVVSNIGFMNNSSVVATYPLVIFGNYYNNALETTYATYTFYGLNILDKDLKYVARFMPWLDNGEACVKDLISGKIYKNTGTGAFDYIDLEGVVHSA